MGRLVAHLSPRDMDPSFSLEGTRTVIVEEADALYAGALPGSTTYYPKVEDEGQRRRRVVQEAPLANWKWLRSELPEKCATALVTCVVPEDVYQRILEDIPGLKMHVGKGIHMTRPGVVTRLVDCSQPIWDDQLGRCERALLDPSWKLACLSLAVECSTGTRSSRRSSTSCCARWSRARPSRWRRARRSCSATPPRAASASRR